MKQTEIMKTAKEIADDIMVHLVEQKFDGLSWLLEDRIINYAKQKVKERDEQWQHLFVLMKGILSEELPKIKFE